MAHPKKNEKGNSLWKQAWPYTIGALSASVISNFSKASKRVADRTVDSAKESASSSKGANKTGIYATAGLLGLGIGYGIYRTKYKNKSLAPTKGYRGWRVK